MSLEQHHRWMVWLSGVGFTLVVVLLGIDLGFLADPEVPARNAGEGARAVVAVLIKAALCVTLAGLLILLPTLSLRYDRLNGKPWLSPRGLALLAVVALGVGSIVWLVVLMVT